MSTKIIFRIDNKTPMNSLIKKEQLDLCKESNVTNVLCTDKNNE